MEHENKIMGLEIGMETEDEMGMEIETEMEMIVF